ncbi:MAG: GEVED domain-containing protein [Pseudomonadota bacterium]
MRTALIALLGGLMADQALAVNYCDSRAGSARYEWITGVAALPGATQNSGMDNGYRDATGLAPLPLKYTGAGIGLRGLRSSGRTNPLYWGAWIDFNQNGVFESSERVLQAQGLAPPQRVIQVPANARPGITRMRVQLRANSDAQPCGYYAYGETEDYRVELTAAVATYPYRLDLQPGFWVERSGDLGDNLTLVVERDGQVVLERNAAGDLRDRYWNNVAGSKYRLWLKRFENGAYRVVSNTVTYRPGITDSVTLARQPDGRIEAAAPFQGNWVVERNGQVVTRQPALEAVPLLYPFLFGEHYRVWAESQGSVAEPLSIALAFREGFPEPYIDLEVASDFTLKHDGPSTQPLNWVIQENGLKVYEQPTTSQNELRYPFQAGNKYKVWLTQAVAGELVRVSDAEYFSPGITDSYQLQATGGQMMRSGAIGDPLTWVIEVNGNIVLERNAANELQYNHPVKPYRAWLTRFIDGYYQRVSNQLSVSDEVGPDPVIEKPFQLALDEGGQLRRSGVLGEPLVWVIEQDGVVVLARNAANELSYTYPYDSGKAYRVWLEQYLGGRYQQVSNVLAYTATPQMQRYLLNTNGAGTVLRSGALGDPVQWVIEENGTQVLTRVAANELSYRYFGYDPSKTYRTWLQTFINGAYQPVSNTVGYGAIQGQQFQLTIDTERRITRTPGTAQGLQWVIEEGGSIVLKRSAGAELEYRHDSYYPVKLYRVWLEAFVEGAYRPVSAVLTY